MIKVTRRDNESGEKLFRRFKKKCEREGLVKDMKKQEYFESKSERKRRERKKMLKKLIDN